MLNIKVFISVLVIFIILQNASGRPSMLRSDRYMPEIVQEYDVVIKNIQYDDSVEDGPSDCPDGFLLDTKGVCREVW